MRTTTSSPFRHAALAALAALSVVGCGRGNAPTGTADAAQRVYVAPGAKDEFYAFMSGGFSGQVSVYGLPSGRHLKTIKVFSQDPETGWGYSEQTKAMLNTSYGNVPWDDAHHPELSMTDGVPDGRWLFINGNNTPRIARMDLSNMETAEIIEIPNTAGNHASPFVTQNTEYAVSATRFSVPTPQRDGVDEPGLPDPDAGVRLRPGARREGAVTRVGLLHQLQQRAGEHPPRGQRLAA